MKFIVVHCVVLCLTENINKGIIGMFFKLLLLFCVAVQNSVGILVMPKSKRKFESLTDFKNLKTFF